MLHNQRVVEFVLGQVDKERRFEDEGVDGTLVGDGEL